MFENIKGIKIKGCFFADEAKFPLLQKTGTANNIKSIIMSFVYGENGSGKTSIAKAFSEYKLGINEYDSVGLFDHNDNCLNLSEESKKRIYIFDEEYVLKQTRFKTNGLDTIVMFGKQVDLEDKIEEYKKT
jgi:AAA15 family ATPase/GTPase